ncbi:MAG: segregation ATPase FtsK/SpoIIIE, family [Patescibacteria group bacterium]|nr:segregation ATPase FtsK/SpoIIIE, family [Patescibacteria group bacterium]
MATGSKKGGRKKSARPNTRKKQEVAEKKPLLSKAAKQDIAAIILIGLGVLLIVAFFGGAGTLGTSFMDAVKALIGQAAYLVPAAFFGLAILLFLPKRFELKGQNYFGLIAFFIVLAGILQFSLAGEGTTLSDLPSQGGFIGYALWMILHPLLTTPLAIFLLVLVELVVIVIATGVRLADLVRKVFGREKKAESKLEVKQPGFAVNNKLPFRGTVGEEEPKPKVGPKAAMTATLDKDWKYPPFDLLKGMSTKADAGNEKEKANIIQRTFQDFGIEVEMVGVNVGPTVAQYTLKPSTGVKLNKLTALDRNLALALKAPHIRMEAPIAGTDLVGIEVPNEKGAQVRLRDILESKEMQSKLSRLEFVLGRDVAGEILTADLASMPHLLVAGATKAGKSVMINTMLASFLYRNSPAQLRLILVDPKRVELTPYNDIPHLLTPVITDHEKAISAMKWAVAEMERRLNLLADHGKRDIGEYNQQKGVDGMPYIVIVLDEFADLMVVAGKDVETLIVRIAQLARAVCIHLVLASQRPSVGVVTGLIKANLPARVALTTASQIDSRTILDQAGAEKLLGKGDMLFSSPEFMKPKRAQGVLITGEEVSAVTKFLRDERAPQYNEEVLAQAVKIGARGVMSMGDGGSGDDELYDEVVAFVVQSGKASASLLQRRFKVGYSRAARLMDMLEDNGVIGPADGAKPRAILMSSIDSGPSTDGGFQESSGENVSADE